jgi:hypothetical protein
MGQGMAGWHDRTAGVARAGRAHSRLKVGRYAEHQIRTARDDKLQGPVDQCGHCRAERRRVVHRDHEPGSLPTMPTPPMLPTPPALLTPQAGDREDGERTRAQPVRVHHAWPLRLNRPNRPNRPNRSNRPNRPNRPNRKGTQQPAQPQERGHVPRLRPVAELHWRECHPVKHTEPKRGIGGRGAEDRHADPPAG